MVSGRYQKDVCRCVVCGAALSGRQEKYCAGCALSTHMEGMRARRKAYYRIEKVMTMAIIGSQLEEVENSDTREFV